MEFSREKIMGLEGIFMGSDYGKSKCYGSNISDLSVPIPYSPYGRNKGIITVDCRETDGKTREKMARRNFTVR